MEDRIVFGRKTSGAALTAFAAIAVITLSWWALALWPAGAVEPEWLARTRAACFGSARGGLPDASGWILLIGEPLGMFGTLYLVFGESLRGDWAAVRGSPVGRFIAAFAGGCALAVVTLLATRSLRGIRGPRAELFATSEGPRAVNRRASGIVLQDQRGARVALDAAGPSIVTFAFGHCETVCPATVTSLKAARRRMGGGPRLIVVTLDPWRDTPERLPTLAEHFGLEGNDRVLSGTPEDVTRVLASLGIAARRDETTGDIEHVASALLIDAAGRITWRMDGAPERLGVLLSRR